MRLMLITMGCIFLVLTIVAVVVDIAASYSSQKVEQQIDFFIADFYRYAENEQWYKIYEKMLHPDSQKSVEKNLFIERLSTEYQKTGGVTDTIREFWILDAADYDYGVKVIFSVKRIDGISSESFWLIKSDGDWRIRAYVIIDQDHCCPVVVF